MPILAALVLASGVTRIGTASADEAPAPVKSEQKSPAETGSATHAAPPKPLDAPADVYVPVPPTAFRADGVSHLVYELHVTNLSSNDCTMTRVEILDDADKQILARHEGNDLASHIRRPGVTTDSTTEKLKISGGLRAVVYLWVKVEAGAGNPIARMRRLPSGRWNCRSNCKW